jgi:hypothetical protein
MTARFVPVDVGADVSALPESERRALVKTIEAARVLDRLYPRQVWAGTEALRLELLAGRCALGQARLHAFLVNKGPWSQLDHQAPFLPGVPAKPEAANFYPAGVTKAEVEAWMKGRPEGERTAVAGFFTTIRRPPAATFVAVPYSVEYQGELTLEAEGSYAKAKVIFERRAVIRPETQRVLDRLKDVPVDVEPRFVTAERLAGR